MRLKIVLLLGYDEAEESTHKIRMTITDKQIDNALDVLHERALQRLKEMLEGGDIDESEG
jgi:hypothetical protein